jgi:hypothetical protein
MMGRSGHWVTPMAQRSAAPSAAALISSSARELLQ